MEHPALHHIDYRSEGGPNTPENLIVIGWLPGHDCHLPVVHANKRLWQPILKIVVATPGLTAFAARRQLELQGRLTDNGRSRLGPEVLELRRQVPRGRRPLVGWEPGLADEATGDGPSAM